MLAVFTDIICSRNDCGWNSVIVLLKSISTAARIFFFDLLLMAWFQYPGLILFCFLFASITHFVFDFKLGGLFV